MKQDPLLPQGYREIKPREAPHLADRYSQAESHLNRVLERAAKHQLPWDRKEAKIAAMRAILLSWAANYPDCMNSLEDHAEI